MCLCVCGEEGVHTVSYALLRGFNFSRTPTLKNFFVFFWFLGFLGFRIFSTP